jgi:membrane protease YdiL (CAAX protease family)
LLPELLMDPDELATDPVLLDGLWHTLCAMLRPRFQVVSLPFGTRPFNTAVVGRAELPSFGANVQMRQNLRMRPATKPPAVQDVVYWRELLFWLLLLSAVSALGSGRPTRELAGLIEAAAFFFVAVSSAGRLKTLGLEFIAWERISLNAMGVCAVYGLVAGSAAIAVARLSGQGLGIDRRWNTLVLAITLGPVVEEVIFRGYLISLALRLARRSARPLSSAISVLSVATLFAIAHLGTTGVTRLQLVCIGSTGCVYGWIRLRFESTAAAALTHAAYNATLYLGYWVSGCR